MFRLIKTLGIFLFCCSVAFADLTITCVATGTQFYPGDGYASTKSVLALYVSGNETFSALGVANDGAVGFSSTGVNKVSIIRSVDNTNVMKPGDPLVGYLGYQSASSGVVTVNFSSQAAGNWYFIVYDFSADATVGSYAYVKLVGVTRSGTGTLSFTNTSFSLEVITPGFSYKNLSSWTISGTIVPAPDLQDVPVFQFALQATQADVDILVTTINLENSALNFATSPGNADSRIYNVKLYLDDGNQEYNGPQAETLLANIDLPTVNAGNDHINITLPYSVTLNYTDPTTPRYFYVLCSFGKAFPVGTNIGMALSGAKGTKVGGGEVKLTGTLPAGNITTPVKQTNITISEVTQNIQGINSFAISGQTNIRMIDFRLKITEPLRGVSLVVYNNSGTFYNDYLIDHGVNKVSLYKETTNPSKNELIGAAMSFGSTSVSRNSCLIQNLSFDPMDATEAKYYLVYDIGSGVVEPIKANCQIGGIFGGNAVAGGSYPAPVANAFIDIDQPWIWLDSVSVSVTQAAPGDTFYIDMGVRNISAEVHPGAGVTILLVRGLCRPRFYANGLNGSDVSSEYDCSLPTYYGSVDPFVAGIPADSATVVTLHYTVHISTTNAKTNGDIVIDGQLGYLNSENPGFQYNVLYTKHREAGTIVPAARNYVSKANATAWIRVNGAQTSQRELPTYIASIIVKPNKYLPETRRFANDDMIEANAELYIQLANNGKDIDMDSLTIKQNGSYIYRSSDYTVSPNGIIYIKDIGTKSGQLEITCYSNNVLLPKGIILYKIPGNDFILQNLYAYPSPYDPSEGPCQIGFEATQDSDYTLRIYDASGDLIHTYDGSAKFGYNVYAWNGENKQKKKIGRGVYLITIVGKNGSIHYVVRTKLGVK